LDGFGTLLWGLEQHVRLRTQALTEPSPQWNLAERLLIRYLAALWQQPNYDCWEEFPDRIAVSTLAAVYAGLHAASTLFGAADPDGALAAATAHRVKSCVLEQGTRDGHLIKQLGREDTVDASLLWASTPFDEHAMLSPVDPIMVATVQRIETDLVGASGGVHRYRADTFYGGGEWALLTALLGQYYVQVGEQAAALRCLRVVEAHADTQGRLPEQWSTAALAPAYIRQWTERWGSVAMPLLWSHAEHLRLVAALGTQ
jgi:GH15 family glucan-1,4-alpha-glucosidase